MRRLKYIILTVAALFFGVTFAIKNNQAVDLTYYFGISWSGELVWLLLITLCLGVLTGYLFALTQMIALRRRLARAQKEIRNVELEVENLRALPVKDAI